MNLKKSVIVFIVFFVFITVFTTPVSVFINKLPLPKNVIYQNLQGSLWQGSLSAVQMKKNVITNVHWQFLPWQLFTGKAAFQLRWGNARNSNEISGSGIAAIGFNGYQLQDMTVRAPANSVKPFMPIPMGDIYGRVILDVNSYTQGEPLCSGLVGDLTWVKSGVDINGTIEFGVIAAALSCREQQIIAQFDGENSLGLQGDARLSSASSFKFEGFLKPSSDLPAIVHQGIGMFSKVDSQGRYKSSL